MPGHCCGKLVPVALRHARKTLTEAEFLTALRHCYSFRRGNRPPYTKRVHFAEMNLQQARLGIKKLVDAKAVEMIRPGLKNRPAIYIITVVGKELLQNYIDLWYQNFIN